MLLLFIHLAYVFIVINGQRYCWDSADRVDLTFKNNPSKQMDYLPTIRLIQGYYPSQYALQYLAFVYLKEQMGVDVTFYPNNNPNALGERYTGYTHWCGDQNDSTCSVYAEYPQFYFEEIKQDNYDLLFELWPVMESTGKGDQYYDDETVIFGGMSGAYAESSWYIPRYVYDETPEWMILKQLKHNQTLRQIFIDAYTTNSDTNWVKKWYEINNDTLNDYDSNKFDLPTNTTPIIFGSVRGYAISEYSSRLIKNILPGGMDWHFVPFGSEGSLSQFVMEMYRNHLPFVANLYSPHLDFATILNETQSNQYMQFERIALPRNPNNDVTDQCYTDGKCSFPLSPLLKIGNPSIQHTFPEIYQFLLDFRLNTNDVNDIIAYHKQVSSDQQYSNYTAHEKWYETACKWLIDSNNSYITDKWHQDITRFDCMTDDWQHCGFNYYFESFQDASTQNNKIQMADYETIAGSCKNYTSNVLSLLCSCPYIEFQGNNCQKSCAFIGPIVDSAIRDKDLHAQDILNGSRKSVDNYTVFFCSGHGICNTQHSTCQCADGYSGAECETKFKEFQYATLLIVMWIILFFILLFTLTFSLIWLWNHKQYKQIAALSPKMSTGFTIGLMLLCIGAVLYLFHPLTDALCITYYYVSGVGSMLTIMSPLCKTARVAIIFTNARQLKKVSIPDGKLMMYLLAGVVIETLICVAYAILHQVNGGVERLYHEEHLHIEWTCNQSESVRYLRLGNYIFVSLFLLLLCYFGYQNRNTWKIFNEQRCIYFSSFFSLFVFVMLLIFNMVSTDVFVIITTQSGGIFIVIATIWVLFYGVRIYKFYKHPENREPSKRKLDRINDDVPSYVHKLQKQGALHKNKSVSKTMELESIKESKKVDTDS